MEPNQLSQDLARLKESLGPLPEAVANPGFIVVSGLPGTGKTFFCRKLAERQSFCIIESDAMRKVLFPSPNYSAAESARLFAACHSLIEWLLKNGVPVTFDATNLSEHHREHLYRISDKTGARLVLVRVVAPPAITYQRLQQRKRVAAPESKSDADWEIYRRMEPQAEKIRRNYLVADTSQDITPVIGKIIHTLNR
jgi:predicted kinase